MPEHKVTTLFKPRHYWIFALVLALGCSDSDDSKRQAKSDGENVENNLNNANNANTENNTNNVNNTNQATTNNVPAGPPPVVIDVRADTNRDGTVDFDNPLDDESEAVWTAQAGAIFLANIDDDDRSCPTGVGDSALARCNDASDEELDGPDDRLDLARVKLRVTGEVGDDAFATLSIVDGAQRVRLFDMQTEEVLAWETREFSASELREGLEFGIEGKTLVRDTASWDGILTLRVELQNHESVEDDVVEDTVQLKVAPLVLRHHLDPAVAVYSSELGIGGDGAFTNDVVSSVSSAGVRDGHIELQVQDQWTQDYFETGYIAMPGPDGAPHAIDVFIRSANIEQDFFGNQGLREAGRVVYQVFQGRDAAGVTAVNPNRSLEWDTLNSFGNTEVIPPFTHDGQDYPLGRIIRGQGFGDRGDASMLNLFESQQIQTPLYVDTGWLLVAHIDETVSFVASPDSPRGWAMIANDARWASEILQDVETNGAGDLEMFQNKSWVDFRGREYRAAVSVSDVLDDTDVMSANAEAIVEVDAQVGVIKAATGITDDEILRAPFMHIDQNGSSIAYQPGLVNGLVTDGSTFMAPDPHGPRVDGVDVVKAAFENELAKANVTVYWIENWDMFHRLQGEVHCGTNVLRAKPTIGWWEGLQ